MENDKELKENAANSREIGHRIGAGTRKDSRRLEQENGAMSVAFKGVDKNDVNKRLLAALAASVVASAAILFYGLGLAIQAEHSRDVMYHKRMLQILIPIFFGVCGLSGWLFRSFVERWLWNATKPLSSGIARFVEGLPVGFRVLVELAFGIAAPFLLLLLPMWIGSAFSRAR